MDRILLEMQREEDTPPLHPIRRLIWKHNRSIYDLSRPGRLLPLHLGPRSLAREEPS